MDILLNYILVGFAFCFLIDFTSDKLKYHTAFREVTEWGWPERLIFISVWPIGILIFIYFFLKSYFN